MILPTINTVLLGRLFGECGKKCKVLAKYRTEYRNGRPESKWERENVTVKYVVVRGLYLAWVVPSCAVLCERTVL
jgi:hypothetical protein